MINLTYLTGLMILFIGFMGGGLSVWLYSRARIRQLIDVKNVFARSSQTDNDTKKLLQSRLFEQKKLYQSKKDDATHNASAAIERLDHAILSLKKLKGILK